MRKYSIRNIFQSEFVKNAGVLIGGNVAGQLAAILLYPVLTRIYSDVDLGIFSLLFSVCGILSILSTGRYEDALVITRDERETVSLLGFIFRLLSVFCLVIFIILLFFKNYIYSAFNIESIQGYWYLIPVFVFFSGIFNILVQLSTKVRNYKAIASSGLIQNLAGQLFKIAFNFFSIPGLGLVLGQFTGLLLSLFSYRKLKSYLRNSFSAPRSEQMKAASEYRTFPQYHMGRNLLNAISGNLPFLLLTGIFGEATLGLFSLAFTAVFRPVNLISNSLYQIYYEKSATSLQENKPILPIIKKYWKLILLTILPVFILCFIFAPTIFKYGFGDEWETSGMYFRYMLPWTFIVLLTTPMGFIPVILKKQGKNIIVETLYLVFRCISIYCGIHFKSFNLAILLYSLTGFIFMSGTLIWYIRLTLDHDRNYSLR